MSLKIYDEYKDSKIDIVGLIPKEYEIVRLKFLCDINTGDKDTVNRNPNGTYPFYVRSPIIERIDTYSYDGESVLMAGDGVGAGKVFHYVNGKFDYHQRVYNLHNFRHVFPKFIYYYMSSLFSIEINKGSAKSTVDSVRLPMLENFQICFPNLYKQKQIANYLDKKTAKIDETIAKNEELIQLLEEKRITLINQAVTKGLNPDVPMKDSGIEWIGEIPEHWNIMKMKFLGTARNGLTYKPEDISDEGLLVLRSSNIQNGKLSFKDNVYINSNIDSKFIVNENDLLICSRNGSRQLIGKSALITPEISGNTFGAFMMLFKSEYNAFIQYALKSKIFAYYIDSFLTSTINQLTLQNFNNMAIPITLDLNEQREIQSYLDTNVNKINDTIDKIYKNIKLLDEYKTSLIHHVVTGKVDVRGEEI